MKNYDKMFEEEQKSIELKQQLLNNEKEAQINLIINFCNEGLFDFLDYLHNKFYVRKHSVNYQIDRKIYEQEIVYDYFGKDSAIEKIKDRTTFRTGIHYKWSNGGLYDTLVVRCVDYKPILTYEGKNMNLEDFTKIAISQLQKAINENSGSFQIIEKSR
jgi:hypothetical protein